MNLLILPRSPFVLAKLLLAAVRLSLQVVLAAESVAEINGPFHTPSALFSIYTRLQPRGYNSITRRNSLTRAHSRTGPLIWPSARSAVTTPSAAIESATDGLFGKQKFIYHFEKIKCAPQIEKLQCEPEFEDFNCEHKICFL